jgi:hypothetical protein
MRLGGRVRLSSVRLRISAVGHLLVRVLRLLILLLLELDLTLSFGVGVLLGEELIVQLDRRRELRLHVIEHV